MQSILVLHCPFLSVFSVFAGRFPCFFTEKLRKIEGILKADGGGDISDRKMIFGVFKQMLSLFNP
jgi:hypothetical protein